MKKVLGINITNSYLGFFALLCAELLLFAANRVAFGSGTTGPVFFPRINSFSAMQTTLPYKVGSECDTVLLGIEGAPDETYRGRIWRLLDKKFPGSSSRFLTSGGESVVFTVDWMGQSFAVKTPMANHRHPLEAYRNEYRQYQLVSSDVKRLLVPLLHLDEDGPFLTMEMIGDGRSLLHHVSDYGPDADPIVVLQTILNIAIAVNGLHDHGIAHVDLKPENILVEKMRSDRAPRVYLADLSMATTFGAATPYLDEERVAGTPQYMPREASFGNGVIHSYWDLNALMIICQALVLGELPFLALDESYLRHEFIMGRQVKLLSKSPYTILKNSGMSPILSAISYIRFPDITLLMKTVRKGILAHRKNNPKSFFDFYQKELLIKMDAKERERLISESDELKEWL